MSKVHLRKYGVEATIDFDLFEVDGVDLRVDAAHASGDTKVMKDEGAEANTSNGFTDEGQTYSIVLTATEMQAARIKVIVVDSATKVWLDVTLTIETYGNASAQHAFDFDTASSAQTGDSFARIGAAGASLTAINLPNQTMDITGDITGNLSGSVGSVTGAVGSVTGAVGSVTGAVGSVAGNVDGLVSGTVAGKTPAEAGDAMALTSDERDATATALLKLDWTGITGEASRSCLNAFRWLRNKFSISGTTMTVTKENDTDQAWQSTLSTDAAADPVTGSDPA